VTKVQHERAEVEDERRNRALTDEDVKAIVDELEARVSTAFFRNLGKGIFGLFWNAALIGILALAGYGAWLEIKK
jgi:restriction endonuclease Mrr